MGKYLSRREFLKGTAAAGLSAAAMGLFHLPVKAEEGSDKYIPGTYTDTEETGYSSVTVTMEFSSDAITSCEITSEGAQDLLTDDKKQAMAAAIVEGQSSDVDAVTSCSLGASVAAIQTAVAKCIAQATAGNVPAQLYGSGLVGNPIKIGVNVKRILSIAHAGDDKNIFASIYGRVGILEYPGASCRPERSGEDAFRGY